MQNFNDNKLCHINKDRHIDQCEGILNVEINIDILNQLSYDKCMMRCNILFITWEIIPFKRMNLDMTPMSQDIQNSA